MTLKINYPKEDGEFEDKVAYLRAFLIQETINRLEATPKTKNKIKWDIIKIFSQI